MVRRSAAALVLPLALALAGCGLFGNPIPSSSTSPTAAHHSASRTDEQTEAAAAIETAYRRSFDELNRLEIAGGAKQPTPILRETISGNHLRNYMKVLRADKKAGLKQRGHGKLVGISVGAGTETRRPVTACEDYSKVRWLKKDGSELPVGGPIRYLQRAIALKRAGGQWKVDSVSTTKVADFSSSVCVGGSR